MFVPQSQAHHMSRSHGAPGTARRGARDKENAGALPSKTPVRAPLGKAGPSTGRALGSKTVDRNILAPREPSTDIAPKRLFQNTGGKELKGEKGAGPSQAPLRVKTPAPQRGTRTPGPRHTLRTPAPQLNYPALDPTPAPLPSAQRTRRRSRASFNTPPHGTASGASHHDPDASLDNIVEADVEATVDPASDSDYELEYAPPTAIDRPYVPEWADSIPDPVETMAKLTAMRPMNIRMPPPIPDDFDDLPVPTLDLCSDDELENPALRRKTKPAATKAASAPRAPLRAVSATSAAASRGASAASLPKRPAKSGALRPTTTRPAARPQDTAPSGRSASAASASTARKPLVRPDGPSRATAASAARTGAARATASSASRSASATTPTTSSAARTTTARGSTSAPTSRAPAYGPPSRNLNKPTPSDRPTQMRAQVSRPGALRGLAARPPPTPSRSPSPVIELPLDITDDMVELDLGDLGLDAPAKAVDASPGTKTATQTIESVMPDIQVVFSDAEEKTSQELNACQLEQATHAQPCAPADSITAAMPEALELELEAEPTAQPALSQPTSQQDNFTPDTVEPHFSEQTAQPPAEPATDGALEIAEEATPETEVEAGTSLAAEDVVEAASEAAPESHTRALITQSDEAQPTPQPEPVLEEDTLVPEAVPETVAVSEPTSLDVETQAEQPLSSTTSEPAELDDAATGLSFALDFELAELSPEASPVLGPVDAPASPNDDTTLHLSPTFQRSTLARISEHTEPCDMSLETLSDGAPHDCDM